MITNSKPYILTIVFLITIFGVYNYIVYNADGFVPIEKLSSEAVKGQQLCQSNRCWSCHQLHGLGGYLGPDLTNVYSDPDKVPNYIKAFLNSVVKSMPQFNFSEIEKNALVEYLKQVDETYNEHNGISMQPPMKICELHMTIKKHI